MGYCRCALSVTAFAEAGSGKNARMPDSNPSENVPPKHDPFDAPDVEDEADTRERVLEGGEDAGDGDTHEVRRELGLEEDGDFS
jgi:hypothetical protein